VIEADNQLMKLVPPGSPITTPHRGRRWRRRVQQLAEVKSRADRDRARRWSLVRAGAGSLAASCSVLSLAVLAVGSVGITLTFLTSRVSRGLNG
jgi:hypothetical protein